MRSVTLHTWLSPRELAFAQDDSGGGTLHKLDVESRQYWSICTVNWSGGLHWAPTKDRLIIQGTPGAASSKDALIEVDGRHVVPAAATGPPECQASISLPFACNREQEGHWYAFNDWAPDSKRVLLTRYDCQTIPSSDGRDLIGDLYLWEVGSKPPKKLVPHATFGVWSPDGSQIAFLLPGKPHLNKSRHLVRVEVKSGRPSTPYVGIMRLATRAVHTLAPLGPAPLVRDKMVWRWDQRPLWSPTGKQVAVRDLRWDVFLLQADGTGRWPLT